MPADSPSPNAASPASDAPFKRMMTVSTVLSLTAVYGWLAGFARQTNGDLSFHWRWLVLLWALIGLGSTAYFWHKIWPPAGKPDATRKDIVKGSLALALPGGWWLLFPLRSFSGQHFWEVVEGLTAAAMVLAFGAWMVMRLGRAFEGDGTKEK